MSVKTPRVGPGDNQGLVNPTDVLFHVDKDVAITTRLIIFPVLGKGIDPPPE